MVQTSVYVGNDPASLSAYTRWMGKAPDDVLFYLNNDSWKAFDSSIGWAVNLWKPSNTPVIWSVPLTVTGTSLEQVATGAYNSHFLQAAQALAQSKPSSDGNIYVRVGWEFNGSWMPWSAQGHEAAFVQSYQNLVNTFRSVSSEFKFVWDVNAGGSYDPSKAYPGDKYVDVVGMDVYYTKEWDSADPHAAFLNKVNQSYGLQWQQDFAAAHGKATAISEWGISADTSGPYIQDMVKWMSDHHMTYENYWDTNAANYPGEIDNGQYPTSAGIYQSAIASLQSVSMPSLGVSATGLIDTLYYRANYADVAASKTDPTTHYDQYGWQEGRNPDAFFFTTGYEAANPDVAKAGVNPLTHYAATGWKEGRDPSASFDNELYLAHNPDVKAAGINPLVHYLQNGQAEGRQIYAAIGKSADLATHPGFDAEYYLLANADVAKAALAAGGDSFTFAYQHYETYGFHEGRNPNAVFDTKGYLAAYADVKAANIDPLMHYDTYGWKEGRDPSAGFDTKAYLAANPDVKAAVIDPMLHYLQHGALEGRGVVADGHFG